MAKKGFDFWLSIVFSMYPLLMIGAYYIGWKTLFYVSLIPIVILVIIGLVSNIKYGNWKQVVLSLFIWIIFSEIGYLITKSITDGICIGYYIALIAGVLENFVNKSRKKNPNT